MATACPGSAGDPQAQPGNLCVYLAVTMPDVTVTVADTSQAAIDGESYESETHVSSQLGDGRAGRTGFMIALSALASHEAEAWGTWAVSN